MDIETYNLILEQKGIDPYVKLLPQGYKELNLDDKYFSIGIMKYRSYLGRNKACWINNYKKDFNFFIINNHPVLGIIFAPKIHPFSRKERLVVLLVITAFSVLSGSTTTKMTETGSSMTSVMLVCLIFAIIIGTTDNIQ